MEVRSQEFPEAARAAIANTRLQEAVKSATDGLLRKRAAAVADFSGWEELREKGRAIKSHTIANLPAYVNQFSENARRRSARVFLARDAAAANRYILELATRQQVKRVVKSKSMVTEEIGLNAALERGGIESIETDLGEYIIQLAGERPSHIVAPVIHRTREDISQLFAQKLGSLPGASEQELTQVARRTLREKFLTAEMGISGGNFAVAETGSVVIVENEGNARLTTSVPRIHVAVIGMEKLIPRWADLQVFLQLLARSGTGQKMTSYVSILTGPKRSSELDGPQEAHIVILDNGRSAIAADPKMRESLHCIRCGACLNTCPVYRQMGGHPYGWAYSGPIGAVFTPLMVGMQRAPDLPFASSLCGACESICPVKIPIPSMLLHLRQRLMEKSAQAPLFQSLAMAVWRFFMQNPTRYRMAGWLLRKTFPLVERGPGSRLMENWTKFRELPRPAERSFRQQWRKSAPGSQE
ncbi:MAG TPA: LutB/LldF family L-lactate oxidation iron-sulfur protein [Acidobacteriota bacterium]|jgi:L-lactate dehydrogenase complex protein LldF